MGRQQLVSGRREDELNDFEKKYLDAEIHDLAQRLIVEKLTNE